MKTGIALTIGLGVIILVLGAALFFLPSKEGSRPQLLSPQTDIMRIRSPAFQNGATIPKRFTCDGADINPELVFEDVPQETKSLVLIMDDPDVPKTIREDGTWDHWLVWNIPPDTKIIPEQWEARGVVVGRNTGGTNGYEGPCPPDREHRYFFKLYALDTILNLSSDASKTELIKSMEGHIIAQAELIGLYKR